MLVVVHPYLMGQKLQFSFYRGTAKDPERFPEHSGRRSQGYGGITWKKNPTVILCYMILNASSKEERSHASAAR